MSADEHLESQPSRYVVGIDLGTTNSAVCYVDTHERPWQVRVLEIPQLVAPGQVEARDTLPSFHYQPVGSSPKSKVQSPKSADIGLRTFDLGPDSSHVVGFMARDWGSGTPGRLVSSAKSWLCHTGVDRTAELLPWHAASDVERISPVEASSRYLAHIRRAWDAALQSRAARPAGDRAHAAGIVRRDRPRADGAGGGPRGLPRVVLIEEPQAAFYAWIYKHQDNWDELVSPGQKILVCDIGGGTTDFTLIRVRRGEQGKVQFHRVAVGDHLILGGDNMDLALAQHLEAKLTNRSPHAPREAFASRSETPTVVDKLQPRQWDVLLRAARQAKEQLLADDGPERVTVSIPGSGSKLIGGSLQTEVTRDEARRAARRGLHAARCARPTNRPLAAAAFRNSGSPMPPIRR